MFNKLEAPDFIAILVIAGGFILLALGVDTVVGGVVTMTVGYYFGRKTVR
jgi:hypothetical protein